MTNSRTNRRQYVDSLYVSRSYGDKVKVRTYLTRNDANNSYVIIVNGRRVVETRAKSQVREYIMDNDCQPVETH